MVCIKIVYERLIVVVEAPGVKHGPGHVVRVNVMYPLRPEMELLVSHTLLVLATSCNTVPTERTGVVLRKPFRDTPVVELMPALQRPYEDHVYNPRAFGSS
eukprot:TRINITY_DN9489_c0_g1_i4.p1 TRINITY_DN9489_c0_g1~~TRINITY_DN9489_c0_g1_i4.p1  ORF type:complete len:101 (+),score=7.41 TRINITY_DN9489_c0_g1_i4:297-599(+)